MSVTENIKKDIAETFGSYLVKDIDNDIKNPPIYDITNGAHCAVWVAEKLQKADIIDFGVNFDGGFLETIKTNPYFQYFFGINFPQDPTLPKFLDHKATIESNGSLDLIEALKSYKATLNSKQNNQTITLYDPLTLDLNNDGVISTTNLENGVYFDHNGDKIAFKTTWIGKNDGFLVYDKNSNDLIDNGSELFGNLQHKFNKKEIL